MNRVREFFKRYKLWLVFASAIVPLALLMGLQYFWLQDLQKTTAIARQVKLNKYVEGVLKEVAWYYSNATERALDLPYSLFTQNKVGKAAYYFKKKRVDGVKRLFVMDYVSRPKGLLLFYDPEHHKMYKPSEEPEVRSIYVACAPFALMSHKHAPSDSVKTTVDERDPDNYMILQPITDEESRLVGVAGLIVDLDFFHGFLLPKIVKESLPEFSSASGDKDLVLTVFDPRRDVVFATGQAETSTSEVIRWFPWIFTHYRLVLQSTSMSSEQWAKSNFLVNLTLSGLLALVLLGGITVTLRTASREMKLSDMKTDFVSNVSHELRTPLASIRVFGEFLRLGRAREPGKVKEYGEYIETESRRLTQLINNILDFSKIESGRKTYHFELADVRDVVDEVLRTFEVRLRHSKFSIRYDRADGELPPVRLDPDAIGQAVHNLLDNAVKYSDGSREIGVGIDRAGNGIKLWVEDHGVGISREEQEKIFERFHRVGTGAVHDVKGSGLGLSIVNHIVKAHEGRISVRSEPGHGSRFSIFLPSIVEEADRSGDAPDRSGGDSVE